MVHRVMVEVSHVVRGVMDMCSGRVFAEHHANGRRHHSGIQAFNLETYVARSATVPHHGDSPDKAQERHVL
jgi:hypothetical protein